ncbi:serine hydrolase [Tundrisphaera sp. TA3]|uniref:serine hydrolase n=1 Tax=Tundrisphaera sp. TA3 TaxID=3435775 RepID=UPI003EB7C0FB
MPHASPARLAFLALLLSPGLVIGQDVPARHAEAIRSLDAFIGREVALKDVPALWIAIVDGPTVIWKKGFGTDDRAKQRSVSPSAFVPLGSMTQLFTDLAAMWLADRGKIDIDAPVTTYLPDFKPVNPSGIPITLRQLMAHRSGLGRETPVRSTFEPAGPLRPESHLVDAVASLNRTTLVHAPLARAHESLAGIAVVGLSLGRALGSPFENAVDAPISHLPGMTGLRFYEIHGRYKRPDFDRARGWVKTGFGREFLAPDDMPGPGPAVGLMGRFESLGSLLIALMDDSRVPITGLPKPDTLAMMMTPQFVPPGTPEGNGLGFVISRFQGHKRVGIGGGTLGFASEMAFLPDARLGVVVMASRDSARGFVSRVADVALGQCLAARDGRSLPPIEATAPLPPGLAGELAGRYRSGDDWFDLVADGGALRMDPAQGLSVDLRKAPDGSLLGDDAIRFGPRFVREGDVLRIGDKTYHREAVPLPPPAPDRFAGLIGEYGWDDQILYILERDGRLNAVIGWHERDPLIEREADVYEFPEGSIYAGETLRFRRDPAGRAVEVVAASVPLARRAIDGEGGKTFRIKPTRPVPDILRDNDARGDKPPAEAGDFRAPDLVDLATVSPTIRFDIRYATDNNFLGAAVYPAARAFFQRLAAEALGRAHAKLAARGYGLLIHDSYRPWRVTKLFYDATSGTDREFVADPSKGSKHNRGCAVDLSMYELATGRPVEMVGGYDEFSDRSYPHYPGGTSRQRWLRDLLREAMEAEGFSVNDNEWWHFDFKDWRSYPILDIPFSSIDARPDAP